MNKEQKSPAANRSDRRDSPSRDSSERTSQQQQQQDGARQRSDFSTDQAGQKEKSTHGFGSNQSSYKQNSSAAEDDVDLGTDSQDSEIHPEEYGNPMANPGSSRQKDNTSPSRRV